jgi:internalin A
MPPHMEHHTIGLGEEIIEIYPEFRKRIAQAIEQCRSSSNGIMNLQLLGLRSLPRQILKIHETISELRLDQNQNLSFQQTNGFPQELKSLKLLSLRNCSLSFLDLNLSVLSKLNSLDLQENKFESLPHTITRLKKLKYLNYSKNKLKYLTEIGYGTLEQLEIFDLNTNHLTTLPHDICGGNSLTTTGRSNGPASGLRVGGGSGGCKKLKVFNLSSNLISFLPQNISKLKSLLKLNIERNQLKSLPSEIKHLSLISFRCGYNSIEFLDDNLFTEELGQSIEFFSCVENNLLELPLSLKDITKIQTENFQLAAEFNPLISPPSSVLIEGMKILGAYMRVRAARLKEMQKLLLEGDFIFEPENAKPSACEVRE